ncbi:MAG: hypothetical protein HY619_00120 [Thaumarchaeota archaeon]|nr:hypothetical protein [Nitrososphaerota archaeon]
MASSVSLKDIHEEIRELRLLYKHLVDRLISLEEATKEEKGTIRERDEIVDERELLKTLGVHG